MSIDRPPLSESELTDAFARVQENEGCAGVDGVTIARFAERLESECRALASEVNGGLYRALPLRRILVEKKPGSAATRTLLVPVIRDRVVQTAVARRLSRSFEEEFLEASFAYRPGRGVDRAVARIRMLRDQGYWHLVDADVKSYFDSVSFPVLEGQLAARGEPTWILQLVAEWIRCPAWDGERLRARSKGLPQGSPLSPLLANLYLMPLDTAVSARDWKLVRYADDFVVLTKTPEEAREALVLVEQQLKALRLELHPEKTRLASFDEGWRFLGVYFQKDEIWTPWKGQREAGRLVAIAPPMSAAALARFRQPRGAGVMEQALRRAGARHVATRSNRPEDKPVAYLYLTEQGSILRKSGDRFLVEHEDRIVLDLPYHKLEQILIFGNVQVTTQAMVELLEKGVDLSFFSWQGLYRGSLASRKGASIRDRMLQYEIWRDPERARQIARAVVGNKIANARGVVEWVAARRGQMKELAAIRDSITGVEGTLAGAATLDAIRGCEGAAAKAYFAGWAALNRSGFVWLGRSRHPPRDPINALLSLTYTLLTQEIGGLLEGDGLEPALGFLHELDGSRPSLALDLVEAFRHPIGDRLVLSLLERDLFASADFTHQEGGGVLLSAAALRRFLEYYERWMTSPRRVGQAEGATFRELVRRDARRFILFVRGQCELQLYRFGGEEDDGACDFSSVTI